MLFELDCSREGFMIGAGLCSSLRAGGGIEVGHAEDLYT